VIGSDGLVGSCERGIEEEGQVVLRMGGLCSNLVTSRWMWTLPLMEVYKRQEHSLVGLKDTRHRFLSNAQP